MTQRVSSPLLQDSVIQKARVQTEGDSFHVSAAPRDSTAADLTRMGIDEGDEDAEAEEAMRSIEQTVQAVASTSAAATRDVDKELHSFEIDPSQVMTIAFAGPAEDSQNRPSSQLPLLGQMITYDKHVILDSCCSRLSM